MYGLLPPALGVTITSRAEDAELTLVRMVGVLCTTGTSDGRVSHSSGRRFSMHMHQVVQMDFLTGSVADTRHSRWHGMQLQQQRHSVEPMLSSTVPIPV
jgi:hypothetical protein